jgi:hypothetical protein
MAAVTVVSGYSLCQPTSGMSAGLLFMTGAG